MPKQEDIDRSARELYQPRAPHWPGCGGLLALADSLHMRCPHCGAFTTQGLAPEITPERAAEMLATLKARRVELGL